METKKTSQFHLMTQNRFAPLFITQFLGAFNDNVFKNALILMVVYQLFVSFSASPDLVVNLAAALFILPFFIFSSLAGQVADKYEKSMLIRRIKLFEIIIMLGAAAAFYFNSLAGLLALLFFMGTQSAFFGPVKYAVLPEHLAPDEIVGGNGMIGMGTFIAILLGTILAGILVQVASSFTIGLVLVGVAVAGWMASRKIPEVKSKASDLKISLNIFNQTWQTLKTAGKTKAVLPAIFAISWFWFLGAAYLTQFPKYAKTVLNGSESVVTLLLACFSIGIGLGSLLCERLSAKKVELGLLPVGALGITLFGMDLCWAYTPVQADQALTLVQFVLSDGGLRVIGDLVLMGMFGGFYTVPLNAFIQTRVSSDIRARVIAAEGIMNAVFMVLSAAFAVLCLTVFNLTVVQFFLVLAAINGLVGLYIIFKIPKPLVWFCVWVISHFMYRIKKQGRFNIPQTGAAVIVSNHVTFVDWLLISAACRRPVRFVMYAPLFKIPVLNWLFKWVKAIPIDSQRISPKAYCAAFQEIGAALENGELVCIFPEGKLTSDGSIDTFKGGIQKIVQGTDIPVIPVAIQGMWGSFFSTKHGRTLVKLPRRMFSKISLNIGKPVLPKEITNPEILRQKVVLLNQV